METTFYIFGGILLFFILVWIVIKIQIYVWTNEIEKFLSNKHNKSKKDENGTRENK